MIGMESEEIKKMINQALDLQRKGEWEKGLKLLREAEEKTKNLPKDESNPLMGQIRHMEGRILQATGKHIEADQKYREAKEFRRKDPVQLGYTVFQIFINKDYAGIPILPDEVKEIKILLWGWADATKNPKELGDVFQNLAYIEQKQGDIKKAIWLYQVAEVFRGIADDQRGLGLTWARLGECYREIGEEQKAREYGEKSLKYFEKVGDPERIRQVKENVFGEKAN